MSIYKFWLIAIVSLLLVAVGNEARAATIYTVYNGCAWPSASASGKSFYVDPVHGSMSGDGSAAHPWHTLAEVVKGGLFATTPTQKGSGYTLLKNPPIHAGDTVYLLSGDHGAVLIQGWFGANLVGFANTSFVTIAALPGQTPVLESLTIKGASHWAFRGLTFQSLNTTGVYASGGSAAPDYFLISLLGPHDNIVIDSAQIQSAADVSQWTIGDWMTQRASGILDKGGTCIALTNNTITNIGFGIQTQQSDQVLIGYNTINYFADDGIDFGSNDTLITGNLIENCIEDGDGFHRDGMQGQPYNEQTTVNNVNITGNSVIRMTDPKIPYPGSLQGIDAFNGLWNDLNVTLNVIISDAWDGIEFLGVNNSNISGNYLLVDNRQVLPCYGLTFSACQAQRVIYDDSTMPTLTIKASNSGVASTNLVIANNIVTAMDIDISTTNSHVTDNLCIETEGQCTLGIPANGSMLWVGTPGTYGGHNVIPNFDPTALFVKFDTTAMSYDLQLKAPNPALTN
jgi:hypothetical protein